MSTGIAPLALHVPDRHQRAQTSSPTRRLSCDATTVTRHSWTRTSRTRGGIPSSAEFDSIPDTQLTWFTISGRASTAAVAELCGRHHADMWRVRAVEPPSRPLAEDRAANRRGGTSSPRRVASISRRDSGHRCPLGAHAHCRHRHSTLVPSHAHARARARGWVRGSRRRQTVGILYLFTTFSSSPVGSRRCSCACSSVRRQQFLTPSTSTRAHDARYTMIFPSSSDHGRFAPLPAAHDGARDLAFPSSRAVVLAAARRRGSSTSRVLHPRKPLDLVRPLSPRVSDRRHRA